MWTILAECHVRIGLILAAKILWMCEREREEKQLASVEILKQFFFYQELIWQHPIPWGRPFRWATIAPVQLDLKFVYDGGNFSATHRNFLVLILFVLDARSRCFLDPRSFVVSAAAAVTTTRCLSNCGGEETRARKSHFRSSNIIVLYWNVDVAVFNSNTGYALERATPFFSA